LMVAFYSLQTSNDWMCIAGIHGGGLPKLPEVKIETQNSFCHHKVETFPTWHRAYLSEFEWILQNHDPDKAGHNAANRLMLPFWDWNSDRFAHGYPDFVTWPRVKLTINNSEKTVINPFYSGPSPHGRTTRRSETSNDVARRIAFLQAPQEAQLALSDDDFLGFSNTSAGPSSLENPHNEVHSAVGGDMGQINESSFDPLFWFHHCNVERLFYSWQRLNPHATPRNPTLPLPPFFAARTKY